MMPRGHVRRSPSRTPPNKTGHGAASPRHEAREAALQILYFAEVGRTSPELALEAFFAEHAPDAAEAVRDFAARLVRGTTAEASGLDDLIAGHSQHWRLERMATIDRIVLRLAVWELRHEPETPPAVVMNEALELARTFSSDESVAFVNGVLDGIRRTLERETP
jgi:N utilization substance protein B